MTRARRLSQEQKCVAEPGAVRAETAFSSWRIAIMVVPAALIAAIIASSHLRDDEFVESAKTPSHPSPVAALASVMVTETNAVDDMIGRLAARLAHEPDDVEGWRMLGWSYFNTARYSEAAKAFARAMVLKPEDLSYRSSYAEALVQAAGGVVTSAARSEFKAVLKSDNGDQRSRYYLALSAEQDGDLDTALNRWLDLLADAPADERWLEDVRSHVLDLGGRTGRDVAASLDASAEPVDHGSGDPEAQAAIAKMIAKLETRLESSPRDRDGWAMLIRSLRVQRDDAGASAALIKAVSTFADDPSTAGQLIALAEDLGVDSGNVVSGSADPSAAESSAAAALPADER